MSTPSKADVEISRPDDGGLDEVGFWVRSKDGKELTGNQILEAVAEAIILHWPNCPMEDRDFNEFDG